MEATIRTSSPASPVLSAQAVPTIQFQEPSIVRRVRHIFLQFTLDPIVTLIGCCKNVQPQSQGSSPEQKQLAARTNNMGTCLSNIVINTTTASNQEHVSSLSLGPNSDVCLNRLPENPKQRLVFVPLVISSLVQHIVGVVVDTQKKEMSFYDSKGLTVSDRIGAKVNVNYGSSPFQHPLKDVIMQIAHKYGIQKLHENTRRDQNDWNNCGAFVLEHVRQRSENPDGEVFPTPFKTGESYFSAIGRIREYILGKIKSY